MTDVETQLQHRPAQVVTSLRVEVVGGPDKGAHAVGGDIISVGTARDNALVVGDFTVSRYHLEASARPGGVLVTDLGSTNGTYITSAGGAPVRIERAIVPPGALVQLGGTTIRFDDAIRTQVPVLEAPSVFSGMVARSPAMLRLFADIERVAASPTSVLVVGESGTGKERVAEAVHARSARAQGAKRRPPYHDPGGAGSTDPSSGRSSDPAGGPFVTIDAGALASTLLASELFGHERGAFTGADRTYPGAFERAGSGTVFLDEIGELPTADQAALLGVLERRRFRRVGGTAELELGARIIAATNRDLRAEVNTGRFRHDLYHRLAVVVLRIPPLRERPEDILPIVEHFARELGADGPLPALFGEDTLARWQRHPWPGNVRELRNAVEAALVVGPPVHFDDASPSTPVPDAGPLPPYKDARAALLRDFERSYLVRLMAESGGNVSQAARAARMDRSHLIDLLHRHGLKD